MLEEIPDTVAMAEPDFIVNMNQRVLSDRAFFKGNINAKLVNVLHTCFLDEVA